MQLDRRPRAFKIYCREELYLEIEKSNRDHPCRGLSPWRYRHRCILFVLSLRRLLGSDSVYNTVTLQIEDNLFYDVRVPVESQVRVYGWGDNLFL